MPDLQFVGHSHAAVHLDRVLTDEAGALADLRLIQPSARVYVETGPTGPYLYSPGSWSDEGEWTGLQPFQLPRNVFGHRLRTFWYCRERRIQGGMLVLMTPPMRKP